MAPRLIPVALAAALLTLGITGAPSSASTPHRGSNHPTTTKSATPTKVLVLGDSYSAGNGAGDYYGGPTLSTECRRSHGDYGNLYGKLEREAGHPTKVTVRACSGAVTDSYWHAQSADVAPQRAAVNKSYDLVMLTLGGNDAKFSNLVSGCLIAQTASATNCDSALTYAEGMLADGTIADRLSAVLSDIESRLSPNAKVVLLGYPYLESDTGLMVGDVQAGARLRTLQQSADTMMSGLVSSLNAKSANDPFVFVATSPLYEGQESWLPAADQVDHELSSAGDGAGTPNPDRWMTAPFIDAGLSASDTFYHPDATGWAEEAQLLVHDTDVPSSFGSGTGWTQVAVGKDSACGVRAGITWCWGGGHSDPRRSAAPLADPAVAHGMWRSEATGDGFSCGVKAGGTLWCWGRQKHGSLGVVRVRNGARAKKPVRVGTAADWTSVTASGHTACGVQANGTGWCWGDNVFGQLGRQRSVGTHAGVAHPVEVSGNHAWSRIVLGAHQACGILRGGRLACWGADRSGALGRAVTSGETKGAVTRPGEIRMALHDGAAAAPSA